MRGVHVVAGVVGAVFATITLAAAAADDSRVVTHGGFQVELIYRVPRPQGSWVALTIDPAGRFITSDQKGNLYRSARTSPGGLRFEALELPIGHAHALLYAFDSLYAVVAEKEHEGPGLYRIRDTNGDDQFDQVELLRTLSGTGEHGPHSVIRSPKGDGLLLIAGNKTKVPSAAQATSRVPRHWGEDDLLPRIWGPIGSEAGTPAPGGWIAKLDPNGNSWEIQAVGLRNGFDLAINQDGELFTVDADAEFDMGTPWYQPTRVLHVVEGTDFGWRSGSGKWQPHFADTLPPVIELGPGSPTGIAFGHGTDFPETYRNALFVADWSRGRIVAVHTRALGASYEGTVEPVASGTPLPVTDLVVNSHDGQMYFTVGGRGTSSGLYRLSHTPGEAPIPSQQESSSSTRDTDELRQLRHSLVAMGSSSITPSTIDRVWPHLSHPDRVIRHQARLVLEQAPVAQWRQRALAESNPQARITAILALARADDKSDLPEITNSLTELTTEQLDRQQDLTWLRCLEVALLRGGKERLAERQTHGLRARLENRFPTGEPDLDAQLVKLLVYLGSENVTERAVQQMTDGAPQHQQLDYALHLRHQQVGWTPTSRERFFALLSAARSWGGGLSLQKYVERIWDDALQHVPSNLKARFERRAIQPSEEEITSERSFVRKWTVDDLLAMPDLHDGDITSGRRVFSAAKCFACHRLRNEGGGVGPDLTTVAKRLSKRDLAEAIVSPNKVISDQFAASTIVTTDGRVITGRVVNVVGDKLLLQTDMLKASELIRLPESEVDEMRPSKVSPMPTGLLDSFAEGELRDLFAFLLAAPE